MSRRAQLLLIAGAWILCALHAGRVVTAVERALEGPYSESALAAAGEVRPEAASSALRVASR